METLPSNSAGRPAGSPPAIDRIGLSWLVTVRWTALLAVAGTVMAGLTGLQTTISIGLISASVAGITLSNLWLMWRISRDGMSQPITMAGLFVCADVLLLTGLLLRAGGALNPASAFYLVQIVTSALVLGRVWTGIVTALSVGGYTALSFTPTSDLSAAQVMHPEIALHMRGMWVAFALTSLVVGVLVTRLAIAVERRDRALERLRDQAARATRFAGLTTLATGAAHELSTPLATMAVAAHEMERTLANTVPDAVRADLALIRVEIDRCRRVLEDMTGRSGQPSGAPPELSSLQAVVDAVTARLAPAEAQRVSTTLPEDVQVVWPAEVVVRALLNLVRNGLQASSTDGMVALNVTRVDNTSVRIDVVDLGAGMTQEQLARAGEPFFTTKPPGAGTGLGLFVSRSSITQIGGTMTLVSAPGRGTTATVVLPLNVISAGVQPS
jgi:two-component system sensor histidine kinase RegB